MKLSHLSLLLFCLLLASCSPKNPGETTSTNQAARIDTLASFPSNNIKSRDVFVYLPENYDQDKQYAVLYMHDGRMLFDSTTTWNKQEWQVDETIEALLKAEKIKDCIVVGVPNGVSLRHSEYFPQKPFESLSTSFRDSILNLGRNANTPLFDGPVQSDAYLKFLVEELKPHIDQNYATLPDAANTFVAGSSMGGLISMYAICEYPEVFGGAACLSTHWVGIFSAENNPIPDAFVDYLAEYLPQPEDNRIYFDYGTETLDALYEPFQLKVDSVMEVRNYQKNQNWKTLKFPGADHSERSWSARLEEPLVFLLGK
ncbi:MAG: alpha/beta hydrolase-fold protein [Bacteroidota bacterium]